MPKRRNLAVGTLFVAGAGYLVGILTAPKSGNETRKDIRKKALKAKTEAEHKLKKAHSELVDLLEQVSKKLKSSRAKASQEVQDAVKRAEKVRQKARQLLSAVHEGEADDKDLQAALDEVKAAATHLKKYAKKPAAQKK